MALHLGAVETHRVGIVGHELVAKVGAPGGHDEAGGGRRIPAALIRRAEDEGILALVVVGEDDVAEAEAVADLDQRAFLG